jgi:hypothetical protein
MKRHVLRLALVFAVVASLGAGGLTLAVRSASAEQVGSAGAGTGTAPTTKVVQASMRLRCDVLDESPARSTAERRHCSADAYGEGGFAQGDCGSSWITVTDDGGGNAKFFYGIHSIRGDLAHRNLDIAWVNWTKNLSSSVSDHADMDADVPGYRSSRRDYTATGAVTATLSGWVLLESGERCEILLPSDVDVIK